MALIKLKVSISGAHGSFTAGDVTDWPDFDVPNLIAAEYAERVEPEAATFQVPETATKPSARKRVRA